MVLKKISNPKNAYLHDELTGISTCHCTRLSRSEYSDCPNVHCCLSELTTQENTTFVDIRVEIFCVVLKFNVFCNH